MKKKLSVIVIVLLVLVLCSNDKVQWEKARQENTTAAYDNFLKMYPDSSFRWEATARIAFLRVAERNTVKEYKWFLKFFSKPKDLADKARAELEKLYFENRYRHKDGISSYEKFLKQYPYENFSGKANKELEKLYFQELKKEASITKLEKFQKRYPQGQFSAEILKMLEKVYFEDAESRDSVLFYNNFVKRYPGGELAAKAKSRVEELYNQRHPSLRRAKTVKVTIDTSFPEGVDIDFETVAKRLLEITGLEIVGSETHEPDAELKIKIKGKAVEAKYSDKISRYTGSVVSGSLVLLSKGRPLDSKNFSSSHGPFFISYGSGKNSKPSDAPFEMAVKKPGSYVAGLVPMMAGLFGRGIFKASMKDENWLIQVGAAYALLKMWEKNNTWAIDFLKSRIHEAGFQFAAKIINKLQLKKNQQAVDVMFKALNNKNSSVKREAINALRIMKAKQAVNPLISFLKNENYFLKEAAAYALGDIKDQRAIAPLIEALKTTKSYSLQWLIARSLGQFKDYQVIEPLIELLEIKRQDVYKEAAKSLKRITGKNFGQDQSKWLEWLSKNQNKYKNHRK